MLRRLGVILLAALFLTPAAAARIEPINGTEHTAEPGQAVDLPFQLINERGGDREFHVSAEASWNVSPESFQMVVEGDESRNVSVKVQAPSNASRGSEEVVEVQAYSCSTTDVQGTRCGFLQQDREGEGAISFTVAIPEAPNGTTGNGTATGDTTSGPDERPAPAGNGTESGSQEEAAGNETTNGSAPAGGSLEPTELGAPVSDGDGGWAWAGGALLAGLALLLAAGVLLVRRREDEERAAEPAPGVVFLGKYEIELELGRGAFGTVWLATHRDLERRVVIKQLHRSWAGDEDARRRFEREARVLASLDHPNVVTIHDVEQADGAWFLVMEYVAGGSLEDRLEEGPLPPGEAVAVARGVLRALVEVHEAGVLHRDLKPSNLLLSAKGRVKVADFGIARASDPRRTELTRTTGSPPGTPRYMAPEQIEGEPGDERADLYALGAVLYESLTGRWHLGAPPSNPTALARAVLDREPQLPLEATSQELDAVLRRSLARDPADRFPSAKAFLDALDRTPEAEADPRLRATWAGGVGSA